MSENIISSDEAMIRSFVRDPDWATEYLRAVLGDQDTRDTEKERIAWWYAEAYRRRRQQEEQEEG